MWMNKKMAVGILLCLTVFMIGFIRVDDADWMRWRAAWLLGGGGTLGFGISLFVVGLISRNDD
jgi:cyanate permease